MPNTTNKRIRSEKIEADKRTFEILTKRFGRERAEQVMNHERYYYWELNDSIRPEGRRYRFDTKTGEWKLIYKGDPLYYK